MGWQEAGLLFNLVHFLCSFLLLTCGQEEDALSTSVWSSSCTGTEVIVPCFGLWSPVYSSEYFFH